MLAWQVLGFDHDRAAIQKSVYCTDCWVSVLIRVYGDRVYIGITIKELQARHWPQSGTSAVLGGQPSPFSGSMDGLTVNLTFQAGLGFIDYVFDFVEGLTRLLGIDSSHRHQDWLWLQAVDRVPFSYNDGYSAAVCMVYCVI